MAAQNRRAAVGQVCALYTYLGLSVTPGAQAQAMDRLAAKGATTYDVLKAELAAQASSRPTRPAGGSATATPVVGVRGGHHHHLRHLRRPRFDEAITVLPADFAGALCRDGWAPYRKFTEAAHQSCLAHLRRWHDLGRSNPPSGREIPAELYDILHDALTTRALRDAGCLDDDALAAAIGDLDTRTDQLLRRRPTHPVNRRLLKHLRKERAALFTF